MKDVFMSKTKEVLCMYHSDPTANQAIGNVSSEWKRMVSLALRLRSTSLPRNWEWEARQRARFQGIYRRLLTDPVEELEQLLHKKAE